MSVVRPITRFAFYIAPGGGWLFAPFGLYARPYSVSDAGTQERLARRYAWAWPGNLILAVVWTFAVFAYPQPDGWPDPAVFFGGLAGLVAAGFALTWVMLRTAVRGVPRASTRLSWRVMAAQAAADYSAETLASSLMASAGLAGGLLMLALVRDPAVCVFVAAVLGWCAFVLGHAYRLKGRSEAVGAAEAHGSFDAGRANDKTG